MPIPRFLAEELAGYITGKDADDLVFAGVRRGGALRVTTFQRAAFDRAAAEVGARGLRPHDHRHTAASLAIQSRATIKVVQKMLGHASATITLMNCPDTAKVGQGVVTVCHGVVSSSEYAIVVYFEDKDGGFTLGPL